MHRSYNDIILHAVAVFGNDTLLTGAALLTDALKAATAPQYQNRITYDLMHLQCLLRPT